MSHLDDDLLAGLSALAPDERRELAPHLDECARCRGRLAIVGDVVDQLDAWQVDPPSDDDLDRVQRAVLAAMDGRAVALGRRWPFGLSTFVVGVGLAAIAKQHSSHAHDWVEAGSALLLAVGLAHFAAAKRLGAIGVAVGASFVLALLGAAVPGLAPAVGVKCLLFELATASVPSVVAWRAGRRGEVVTVALAAAAGALAGMAALHVACPVHEARAHLFAFHVGGVAVAAALGALADRTLARRTRPT
jgi:hypothetical protein